MAEKAGAGTSLVRKLGQALNGQRVSRRAFFARVAVVGSALSLDPVSFATKPASAYDAVCGDAASCANGYSVFCCTINNGGTSAPTAPSSGAGGRRTTPASAAVGLATTWTAT